jgi:hypothetical protein
MKSQYNGSSIKKKLIGESMLDNSKSLIDIEENDSNSSRDEERLRYRQM